MDYPRDNVFTFLFSTYKRTAGIAMAAILILAVPVTVALIARQQDIRQHASTGLTAQQQVCQTYSQQLSLYQSEGLCNTTSQTNPCNLVKSEMAAISCPVTTITPIATTITPVPTVATISTTLAPSATCVQKPAQCGNWYDFLNSACWTPSGGWCPTTTTTPTPSVAVSPTVVQVSPTVAQISPTVTQISPDVPTTTTITPVPSGACVQKPAQCGNWYDFLNSACWEPAAGWCPVTTTPTPSVSPSPSTSQASPTSAQTSPTVAQTSPTVTPVASATLALSPTVTSGPTPTSSPLSLTQRVFDFNDDGVVDEIDLNILYAAFRTRQGD